MKRLTKILLSTSLSLATFAGVMALSSKTNSVKAAEIPAGQTKDEIVDVISVSDLTFSNVSGQSMLAQNKNTEATFTFSEENVNKNLVFKFKYDVADTTATDANAVRIALDVVPEGDDIDNPKQSSKWNGRNSLWLRGDGTYFARYSSGWSYTKLAALTEGLHEIEYGRVALLDETTGAPSGKYYVFYKLDGTLVRDQISEYDSAEMDPKMFIQFSEGNTKNRIYDSNLTYEEPQVIGVHDLMTGGASVGLSVPNKSVNYSYSTANQPTNKSAVFVADINYTAAQDSQIYITTSSENWNQAGYIWLRQNKVYFGRNNPDGTYSTSEPSIAYPAPFEVGSKHSIEYGRLAVMNGEEFTGKYHVYFKLDGNLVYAIDQAIVASVAAGGTIHLTGDGGFTFVDSSFALEDAKVITLADLKQGDSLTCNTLNILANTDLTYSNEDHTDNYSLIFKFKYDAIDMTQNQFHFSTSSKKWDSASSIILNNDNGKKVHLGKSTATSSAAGWYDIEYTMTEGSTYDVEYGRLAILSDGEFSGNYYVYLKINGEVIKSTELAIPQEVVEGNVVFISAGGLNTIHTHDFEECGDSHTLVHFDGTPATCLEDGLIEYWLCTNCGKYFADAEGKTEVTDFKAPATGHAYGTPTYTWTETANGYKCTAIRVCEHDKNHKQTEEINGIYQEVTPATCTTAGQGKYEVTFTNPAFEAQEKLVDIPATDHAYGTPTYTWVDTEDGFKCVAVRVCEHDENHKETEEAVGVYQEVTPATCTTVGQGKYVVTFENAAFQAQEKLVDLLMLDHNLHSVDEVAATTEDEGVKAHFVCEDCNKLFMLVDGNYVEVSEADLVIEKLQPEQPSVEPSVEPSPEPSVEPSETQSVAPAESSSEKQSEQPSSPDTGKKKGCKGGLAASGLLSLVAFAGLLLSKKRKI